jgi:hypothetical protein
VANSFDVNDCENANTHAHGDVHLVVLAHLRRQWSSAFFVEVKCLFFTMPEAEIFTKSKEKEAGEETETKGGHWCDRTLDETQSRHDRRARSVAAAVRGAGR